MADTPRRSWRTWALVASLGLNLAFLGVLAGALLKGPPPPPMPGIGGYARALPDLIRHDLGRALRHSRPDWAGMRETYHGRRAALAAIVTADPFDPAAMQALLDEDRRLASDLATRGGQLLVDQVARMSPAERASYAEALTEERRGRDGRRH
jgi:uncharacterized membrane protein